jgi:hypothetical protein
MDQPDIVARMVANKDWESNGRAISLSIMNNPKEIMRRRLQAKKILVGRKWEHYTTAKPTKTEGIMLALFPTAQHNFIVKTGASSKIDRTAQLYRLDLAWPNIMLDVEIDGKYHNEKMQLEKDRIRDSFLKSIGWKVLRFKSGMVIRDQIKVKEIILSEIKSLTK